jgi:hypothetical protein
LSLRLERFKRLSLRLERFKRLSLERLSLESLRLERLSLERLSLESLRLSFISTAKRERRFELIDEHRPIGLMKLGHLAFTVDEIMPTELYSLVN